MENPADLATRGKTVRFIKDNELWWKGPEWLLHASLWPQPPVNVFTYDSKVKSQQLLAMPASHTRVLSLLNDKIENNMSSWNARVCVFRNILTWKTGTASDAQLLKTAENLLIKELQKKYYGKELRLLKKGIRPSSNWDLYLDSEGLLRCGGRLQPATSKVFIFKIATLIKRRLPKFFTRRPF